jgi:hypothetical protein
MKPRLFAIGATVIALGAPIGIAACGGSSSSSQTTVNPNAAEVSPAGDIPDNQVYVSYSPPGAGYQVKVPEGWSRASQGGAIAFTDKLNTIQLDSSAASSAPAVADGQAELRQLAGTVPGFKPGNVSTVKRSAGTALLITYTGNGAPDPVTGKVVPNAFERYEFFHNGRLATLTLSGPVGADNVDPWMIVTDSLQWTA